jgi:hypothetical protein
MAHCPGVVLSSFGSEWCGPFEVGVGGFSLQNVSGLVEYALSSAQAIIQAIYLFISDIDIDIVSRAIRHPSAHLRFINRGLAPPFISVKMYCK